MATDLSSLREKIQGLNTQVQGKKPVDATSDLQLKTLQKELKVANAAYQSSRWYGDQTQEEIQTKEEPTKPYFYRLLDAVGRPQRMVVGAAKYALGKADEKSLFEAMNANVQKKDGFGDIIQSYGVPHAIAAPIGFAADVVTDPVNFVGFGGALRANSIIGKVGAGVRYGGKKEVGALAAAKAGLEAGVAAKTAKLAKYVPFSKESAWREAVNTAAETKGKIFDEMLGSTALEDAMKRSQRSIFNPKGEARGVGSASQTFYDLRKAVGEKWGAKAIHAWDMFLGKGNLAWTETQRLMKAAEKEGIFKTSLEVIPDEGMDVLNRKTIAERLKQGRKNPETGEYEPWKSKSGISAEEWTKDMPVANLPENNISEVASFADDVEPELRADIAWARRQVNDGKLVVSDPQEVVRANRFIDLAERLNQELETDVGMADVLDIINTRMKTRDGVDVLGLARQKLGKYILKQGAEPSLKKTAAVVAKGMAEVSEVMNGYFKNAVIGVGNTLTSIEGAIIGNPMMRAAMGLSITDPKYWGRRVGAFKTLIGRSKPEFIDMVLKNPDIEKFAKETPELFEKIFGFRYEGLTMQGLVSEMKNTAEHYLPEEFAKFRENPQGFKKMISEAIKSLGVEGAENPLGRFSNMFEEWEKRFLKTEGRLPTPDEYPEWERGIGYTSQMIDFGAFHAHKKLISRYAQTKGGAWKILDAYLTKPMAWYDLADQTDRLGTFLNLVEDGIPESSLTKLSKFVSLTPEDVQKGITGYVFRDGEKMYKLTGEKAAEVVSTMYLNYAALPGFLRTMRSLPLAGAPFASFSTGMLAKTIQTMVYNPSYVSHMDQFLREVSDDPTPAEQEALKTKYYSFIKEDPMMLRLGELPFFRNNPVYLNAKGWNPFVANVFSPSQRVWSDTFKGNVGQFIDSLPFFKQPGGSALLSYFILPSFLEEGEQPQGVFGQPLYPKDASLLEKSKYFARDIASPYVPKLPSALLGTLTGGNLPDSVLQYAPSAYGTAAYAAQGRSSVGAGSQESITKRPAERMVRNLLGTLGASVMPVEPTKPKD